MFFLLYINVIISYYSFKESAKMSVVETILVIATILEIIEDTLHVIVARVQTLHFNVFFFLIIKYT